MKKINDASSLSMAYHDLINKHNNNIRKNSQILSKIIDCVKFCGEFELPL